MYQGHACTRCGAGDFNPVDAALAASLADEVGAIVAQETGRDPQVGAFATLARQHLALPV